jgi:glycosyltransferase involved in cell wall biosynthesis
MKILLLSAYHAESHKQWCDGLIKYLPEHHWTLLSLPPRHFAWRVRGNSLSWAFSRQAELAAEYDLLIATSLVDLAALRGFVPALAKIPNLVYFHENQFEYPQSEHQHSVVEPQMVNLYSALCADQVVFNSAWNRDSFLDGVGSLLGKLPDQVPKALPEKLLERSTVLPVGLDPGLFDATGSDGKLTEPPLLVWNHRWEYDVIGTPPTNQSLIITWAARWEYDKGPDNLLLILRGLRDRGIDFRLNVLGQSFRNKPKVFDVIREEFSHELLIFGYIDQRQKYVSVLEASHICLSTAKHEFQGLAVLEAVAMGCYPIVPDAMVYPEIFDSTFRYGTAADAVSLIERCQEDIRTGSLSIPDVRRFSWSVLAPRYHQLFCQITSSR